MKVPSGGKLALLKSQRDVSEPVGLFECQ